MNLTSFAQSGPPPLDHIPRQRSFVASRSTLPPDSPSFADIRRICPFATNLQVQVLSCSERQVRIILNDAVVPLTGISGCPDDEDGLCPIETFVAGMQTLIGEVDWVRDCGGGPE